MRWTIKAAFVATAVAGSLLSASVLPAKAETVVIGPPVAYGYNDGYWDREHRWHKWRNEREANEWRRANHEHYYAWRHDRDRDLGWRERDRWWSR